MKRGKRQVVQRSPDQPIDIDYQPPTRPAEQFESLPSNSSAFTSSPVQNFPVYKHENTIELIKSTQRPTGFTKKNEAKRVAYQNISNGSQSPGIQQQNKSSEADQKRRRIEELKKKYLKKNPEKSQTMFPETKEKNILKNGQKTNERVDMTQAEAPTLDQTHMVDSQQVSVMNRTVDEAIEEVHEVFNYSKSQKPNNSSTEGKSPHLGNIPHIDNNNRNDSAQSKQISDLVQNERGQFKIPCRNQEFRKSQHQQHKIKTPPPPPKKKGKPPVISQRVLKEQGSENENRDASYAHRRAPAMNKIKKAPKEQQLNQPPFLLQEQRQNIQAQQEGGQVDNDSSSKSEERQDRRPYAPATFSGQVRKLTNPSSFPRNNIKNVLNKKLGRNDNKPQETLHQQNSELWTPDNSSKDKKLPTTGISVHRNIQVDEQYNQDYSGPKKSDVKPKVTSKAQLDPKFLLRKVFQDPKEVLNEIWTQKVGEALECYMTNKFPALQTRVKGLPDQIQLLIESFMLQNCAPLSPQQQALTQQLALRYFYTNGTCMNDVFLVLLVKLDCSYISKYKDALLSDLPFYLSRLLLRRKYLLHSQIDLFLDYLIDEGIGNQQSLIWVAFLGSERHKIVEYLMKQQFTDSKTLISLLAFCRLNPKKNTIGLYFRLLEILTPQIAQLGLIEIVLGQLKELEVPQNLYQNFKQLKLKMLKNYDEGNKSEKQETNQADTSFVSTEKQGNLFGYFNFQKAIDKIKTSTSNALNRVEKQPSKQQEPKDEIVYDPVKKRYLINGKIPDEESTHETTQQKKEKTPPPPPPPGKKRAPPPPQVKRGKPALNRYV